jgi:alkylation response protein AidB-like acyl-CoA dehydrogenase
MVSSEELEPISEPGKELVDRIAQIGPRLSQAALEADQAGDYAHESVEVLKSIGAPGAVTPQELGGLGVDTAHDFAVAMNRVARHDGSAALIINMHLFRMFLYARGWRMLQAMGGIDPDPLGELLARVAADNLMIAAIVTEPGTDHLHLRTTATNVDGGWSLNGRKGFATGSPGADLLGVVCRYDNDAGEARMGALLVPADADGVRQLDNWDSLGMRASGSQDLVFEDAVVDDDMLDLGPYGAFSEGYLISNALGFIGLAAAFLGIAETAQALTLETLRKRNQAGKPFLQVGVAESECDLAASRALVERSAAVPDRTLARQTFGFDLDEAHAVMKDLQYTKHVVTHAAIRVTDRAMTLSGGSGYLNTNLLSRLYRDVRAGPFMQPFSPNDALGYIGQVALTGSSTTWLQE